MARRLQLALALLLVLGALGEEGKASGQGWQEKKKDGRVVQELKLEAPAMTEEDQYGYVMPDRYRCDSCKAVMFHLDASLRSRHPKSRRMKAWEYTDFLDETCRIAFKGYGIKLVDGQNALSGPGLKSEPLGSGMGAIQMGGENWEKRIGEICRKIVFEYIGEEDIYEMFYAHYRAELDGSEGAARPLSESLCASSEIRHCVTGPALPPKSDAKEDSKKKAKAKDSKKKPKAEKKPEKAKASPAKAERSTGTGSPTASDDLVDVQTFLRHLAVKQGLTPEEYLTSRSLREWEKLTVAMAGRIFNQASEEEGSCYVK